MAKPKLTIGQQITQTQKWVHFLQKALASENFKKNDPERYSKAQTDYDRAKFRLKIMQQSIK